MKSSNNNYRNEIEIENSFAANFWVIYNIYIYNLFI